MAAQKPYVEFRNICQYFPGVKALDGMNFSVNEGSVHALMGENGAGKSTLLKVLSGINQPKVNSSSMGKSCNLSMRQIHCKKASPLFIKS